MMRIGVFSDSHGDTHALDDLLSKMGHIDAVCFLGDIARDGDHLEARLSMMPHRPKLYAVKGNNDYASLLPLELLIELGGTRIYMTHGHIVSSVMTLAYRAAEKEAKIALFGHTHEPLCEYVHGVLVLNPGSAGNSCRGGRARASILVIENDRFRVKDVT